MITKRLLVLEISKQGKVRVKLSGSNEVRDALYALLQLIEIGKVTTYGLLARCLGIRPRHVAYLLKNNQNPVIIPCHRVVKSDLSLGGYTLYGRKCPNFKRKLLMIEGIRINSRGRVNKECVISAISDLLS